MNIKKIRNDIFRKVPLLQYLDGILCLRKIMPIYRYYKKNKKNSDLKEQTIPLPNYNEYKKTILKFLLCEPKNSDVVKEFVDAKINIISEKYSYDNVTDKDVIMICLVKNDIMRIKQAVNYYRNIGIKYFVFIDNASDDGTREFLNEQEDINLYVCSEQYTTARREGWLNRIYSYIGYNKWILTVDSDELFTFVGYEDNNISEYLRRLPKKVKRIRSILLDMYSDKPIFKCIDDVDSFNDYLFFDKDSYYEVSSYRSRLIHGGPRKRIFSTEEKPFECTVSKYPLFFYEKGDFQGSSHWSYPYNKNNDKNIYGVLRHYKFMNGDMKKYQERVRLKNYASGSMEYRRYLDVLEDGKEIVFYYNKSGKFLSSNDLIKIKLKGQGVISLFSVNGEKDE